MNNRIKIIGKKVLCAGVALILFAQTNVAYAMPIEKEMVSKSNNINNIIETYNDTDSTVISELDDSEYGLNENTITISNDDASSSSDNLVRFGYDTRRTDYVYLEGMKAYLNQIADGKDEIDIGGTLYFKKNGSWCYYYPLLWRVVSDNGDKKVLLLDKIYCNRAYYSSSAVKTKWSDSPLRTYLNDTFYNSVFSDEQKKDILDTQNDNTEDNFQDEITNDLVYLLSRKELQDYLPDKADRIGYGDDGYGGYKKVRYWTRTIVDEYMKEYNLPGVVNTDGSIVYGAAYSGNNSYGVRPAISVKSNSVNVKSNDSSIDEFGLRAKVININVDDYYYIFDNLYFSPYSCIGDIEFESSDETILDINAGTRGQIHALSPGIVTIKITCDDETEELIVIVSDGTENIIDCEEAGWKIEKGIAKIVVLDKGTSTGVSDAVVTISDENYISGANGVVRIPIEEEAKKHEISVAKEGYCLQNVIRKVGSGTISFISLSKDDGTQHIVSVTASYKSECFDLLNEKKVFGYETKLSNISSAIEDKLCIKVSSSQESNNYILYYPGEKDERIIIDQNQSGIFEYDITVGGKNKSDSTITTSMPVISVFEPGKKIYAGVLNDVTNEYDSRELGISTTVNYYTVEDEYKKYEVTIGENFEIQIPDNVPMIGGDKVSFSLPEKLPLEIEYKDDGVFYIAINKPNKSTFAEYGDDFKKMKKKAENLFDTVDVNKWGTGYFKSTGKIYGYAELNIAELTEEGYYDAKIGLIAEIEGEGGYKQYWLIPDTLIPVYLYVKGKANGKFDVSVSCKMDGFKPVLKELDITDGSITGTGEFTVGGGVGFGFEIDASVTGKLSYINKPARKYSKSWFEAKGKVEKNLLFYKELLWESDKYKYTLFEKGKDLDDYSFLHSGSPDYVSLERNNIQELNNVPNGSNVKRAVFPNARQKLISINDKLYVFWLEDIIERSSNNRTALVYSYYIENQGWSKPVRLLNEEKNNTLDGDYSLTAFDDSIIVIWQNGTRVIKDEESINDCLKNLQIRQVELDTKNNSVINDVVLTDTSGLYLYPCAIKGNADLYSFAIHDDFKTNDLLNESMQTLLCYKNSELISTIELSKDESIANIVPYYENGIPYVICEMDKDGDKVTSDDREIVAFNVISKRCINITDNDTADMMPTVSDKGRLYWYQSGNIAYVDSVNSEANTIWSGEANLTPVSFETVTNSSGRDSILFDLPDIDANKGTVTTYEISENSDGTYGNVLKFYENKGSISGRISAVVSDSKVYVARLDGDYLDGGYALKDLKVITKKSYSDIELIDAIYDEADIKNGERLPIKIFVNNKGNEPINEFEFSIGDDFEKTISNAQLLPNSIKEFEINDFVVPVNLEKTLELSTCVSIKDKDIYSSGKLYIGCPDFYSEAELRLFEDKKYIDFIVYNDSIYQSSGKVLVHKDFEDGDIICQKEFDDLGTGRLFSTCISDYPNSTRFYVEVVSDSYEEKIGNNVLFVYTGYGTGINGVEEESDKEVKQLSLNEESFDLYVGMNRELTVYGDGNIISPDELIFSSSDSKIASIDDNGVISANKSGKVDVTVYYGELSATCTVNVWSYDYEFYTVILDTQGGERFNPIENILKNEIVKLPIPSDTDYKKFEGWYTMSVGGEKIEGNSIIVSQSITLYAHWLDLTDSPKGLWIKKISGEEYTYTGTAIKPEIKVYDYLTLLKEKTDYTVSYSNNVKVGSGKINVKGKGNYSQTDIEPFTIVAKSLGDDKNYSSDINVSIADKAYNGRKQISKPKVTYGKIVLVENRDYTLSYSDDLVNMGIVTVNITGKDNYTGTITTSYRIYNKNYNFSKMYIDTIPNQTYTGEAIKLDSNTLKVYADQKKTILLVPDKDYKVTYLNNLNVGTATATVTGIGEYESFGNGKSVKFKIVAYPLTNADIYIIGDTTYTGTAVKPEIEVRLNGKKVDGKYYNIKYNNNVAATNGSTQKLPSVTITGKGNYTKNASKYFDIKPRNLIQNDITVTIPNIKDSGKGVTDVDVKPTVKWGKTTLKKNRDFLVSFYYTGIDSLQKARIIFIGNYRGEIENDVRVFSSSLKMSLEEGFIVTVADAKYTGKPLKPKATVIDEITGKKLGSGAYILNYTNNIDISDNMPSVTVLGNGSYSGSQTVKFRIYKNDISKVYVDKIPNQTYTGNQIKPLEDLIVVYADSKKTIKLNAGSDYTIEYGDNIKTGQGKVVLKGIHDYGGEKIVKFGIVPKWLKWLLSE